VPLGARLQARLNHHDGGADAADDGEQARKRRAPLPKLPATMKITMKPASAAAATSAVEIA